jgi:hypothetical protein
MLFAYLPRYLLRRARLFTTFYMRLSITAFAPLTSQQLIETGGEANLATCFRRSLLSSDVLTIGQRN